MTEVKAGALHEIPSDITEILLKNAQLLEKWNQLTPLARNEWICWVTIVKKAETRLEHLERLQNDLLEGKRRPCCWPGCPHRNAKAAKYFK